MTEVEFTTIITTGRATAGSSHYRFTAGDLRLSKIIVTKKSNKAFGILNVHYGNVPGDKWRNDR